MTRYNYDGGFNLAGRMFGDVIYRVIPFDGATFGVSERLVGNQFDRGPYWGKLIGSISYFI